MEDFDRLFLFGIIFDVPPSAFLNSIKESLVQYLVETGMSSRMYVSHPDWQIPRDQGESVYYVTSYKSPASFNAGMAFKDTVSIIGLRNEDCEKYILLITNNFQAPKNQQYRKGFLSNTIRGYDSKIFVFGGPDCDRVTLKSITLEHDAQYFDLDDPTTFNAQLAKILEKKNG